MYDVYATQLFLKQLSKLPQDVQMEANVTIEKLKNGSETGKPLKGLLKDCSSVRVKKEYRLVFRCYSSKNRLELVSIGYRKKFYKTLKRLRRKGHL